MEQDESVVIVLDEGIEESAEEMMACCPTKKAKIYLY